MAEEQVEGISLKALVDKDNNRVIFAEAEGDFVDVLLSLLTMPIGTIIRLVRGLQPTLEIGCMNNLYQSIENLDAERLQTRACKTMLLYPRNAAEAECSKLKLKIDDVEPLTYFICSSCGMLLSYYNTSICYCGGRIDIKRCLTEKECTEKVKGVFVKGLNRFIISDELEIIPASVEATFSLLSKLGVNDETTFEEWNLNIGVDEVLALIKRSLVSKTPLTETLLKHNLVPEVGKDDFGQRNNVKSRKEEPASDVGGKICVKLIVSKSKNMVCFAEASEAFADLLFSFLTVPLGCVVKQMHGGNSKGCITQLYNSVDILDAKQHLKSSKFKEMLLSPKLAPTFSYENHPLGIEEAEHLPFHYGYESYSAPAPTLTFDGATLITYSPQHPSSILTLVDPKSPSKGATSGGYVTGPANFLVTDNLIISPLSPISCLFLLNKLKVPFSDVEMRDVHVGTKEALQLMVTSLVSESVLTNAFLREPKPEY